MQVDKKDLFFGPYRPSLGYTDGVRILAYLDPTEEAHTQAKKYCRALLAKYSKNALKAINERSSELFADWESQVNIAGPHIGLKHQVCLLRMRLVCYTSSFREVAVDWWSLTAGVR